MSRKGIATPRYLSGYGLIELPLSDCIERLDGVELLGGSTLRRPQMTAGSRDDAIQYLDHLTVPATRWVLFAAGARWTAVLTNLREGSDFADRYRGIADVCRARTCRVVDKPGVRQRVGEFEVRMAYPARIFELAEPRPSVSVVVRSIAAALDGDRWVFETSGEPLLVEERFTYDARLKRDRFTTENLNALLASLGVAVPVAEAFASAESVWLLAEEFGAEYRSFIEAWACTTAQADDPGFGYFNRALGWVPHMDTHAESVVWDLTKAILLSPGLAGETQPYLDEARQHLGDARFDEEAQAAEAALRKRVG